MDGHAAADRRGWIGQVIAGRFRIEEYLGGGSAGEVYRARHLLIERHVAIKLLTPGARAEGGSAWFLREARAATLVGHPNIVEIHDFGETGDGLVYLIMELLDGEGLSERIARGPMDARTALDIVEQVASALARAHDLGVVHRDLKPEHVLLVERGDRRGFVKIIDFGLAAMARDLELAAPGAVLGTPGYMAPEQERGEDAGPQADLYSLGVMLFEMLTGRLPEPATPDDRPADLPAGLHPSVRAIVENLLAHDPARRYRDAYHVLDDCSAALGLLEPSRRPSRRSRTTAESGAATGPPISGGVASWALRTCVLARMAAATYAGAAAPTAVSSRMDTLWRGVAELSRLEGELQAAERRDENLRLRAREFSVQVAGKIEDLARTRSLLQREITQASAALGRLEEERSGFQRELEAARSAAEAEDERGDPGRLHTLLEAAGAAAAREEVRRGSIATVENKIRSWEAASARHEKQILLAREQLRRHAARVDAELSARRVRFGAGVREREDVLGALEHAASHLIGHFRSRPECAHLLSELASLDDAGAEPARTGR